MYFFSTYGILKEVNHCQKVGTKMEEFVRLLDERLDYIRHEIVGDTVYIYVESNREEPVCPYCGTPSTRKHSVYERSFQDLPIMGKKTKIILENRKMFCVNPDCPHTTFAETFDFLPPKGKKSRRLLDKIVDISLNVSSLAAAELWKDGIADVGKSTICNLLKKRYTPAAKGNGDKGMRR